MSMLVIFSNNAGIILAEIELIQTRGRNSNFLPELRKWKLFGMCCYHSKVFPGSMHVNNFHWNLQSACAEHLGKYSWFKCIKQNDNVVWLWLITDEKYNTLNWWTFCHTTQSMKSEILCSFFKFAWIIVGFLFWEFVVCCFEFFFFSYCYLYILSEVYLLL